MDGWREGGREGWMHGHCLDGYRSEVVRVYSNTLSSTRKTELIEDLDHMRLPPTALAPP